MAKNLLLSLLYTLPLLSVFFSTAQTSPPPPLPPQQLSPPTICNSTLYPSDCQTILAGTNSSSTAHDYYHFSHRKSLSAAQKLLSLIETYLRLSKFLPAPAIRALQDCKFLAQCNIDNLIVTSQTLNTTSQTLPVLMADDIQTLLSAIQTNTLTCMEGLQAAAAAWSATNGVLTPLSEDIRLFSVSLALFNKAWAPPKTRNKSVHSLIKRKHLKLENGRLNLKMSPQHEAVYRRARNSRRLLEQTAGDNNTQVQVSDIVVVNQDGSWNFTSINDAVNAAPNNTDGSNGYFLIYITAGVYEEYVSIPKNKKYLMMIGDGINRTVITGNHSVVDGWTTFNCSTFAVVATGFFAVDITFVNTAGPSKHQAVAVRNGADLSTFYSCSFVAYQDTLYVHSLRQFYFECDVYGTVDFIFGNAAVVFQNSNFYPRLPLRGQFNAITAQGRTDPNQNTGISVHNCTIRAAPDLAGGNYTVKTYLGRPWKEYSRTVYMQSFMDSLIDPAGWSVWSGDFALNTSYYAEFNNSGPGSDTSRRVTWPGFHIINATDAVSFTVSAFISGDAWIPKTGLNYTGGLL